MMKTTIHLVLPMLMSGVAFGYTPTYCATEMDIKMFSGALETFQLEHGRYPTQSEGLRALVDRPGDVAESKWEPYLIRFLGTDPWGHDYVYRFPGIHNKGSFDLYSLGEDGVSKTGGADPDDINNWDKARSWMPHYTGGRTRGELIVWGVGCLALVGVALGVWRSRRTARQTTYDAAA